MYECKCFINVNHKIIIIIICSLNVSIIRSMKGEGGFTSSDVCPTNLLHTQCRHLEHCLQSTRGSLTATSSTVPVASRRGGRQSSGGQPAVCEQRLTFCPTQSIEGGGGKGVGFGLTF